MSDSPLISGSGSSRSAVGAWLTGTRLGRTALLAPVAALLVACGGEPADVGPTATPTSSRFDPLDPSTSSPSATPSRTPTASPTRTTTTPSVTPSPVGPPTPHVPGPNETIVPLRVQPLANGGTAKVSLSIVPTSSVAAQTPGDPAEGCAARLIVDVTGPAGSTVQINPPGRGQTSLSNANVIPGSGASQPVRGAGGAVLVTEATDLDMRPVDVTGSIGVEVNGQYAPLSFDGARVILESVQGGWAPVISSVVTQQETPAAGCLVL